MLEIKYKGKNKDINVDLLIFIEKNTAQGMVGKEDYEERLESQMMVFLTKYREKEGSNAGAELEEDVEICFEIIEKKLKNGEKAKKNKILKEMMKEMARCG
jgi:hypothetical protein